MTDRVAIRRLPTGVPGLDQILGGGLPEFSFNLIAGAPGAGKTTLAQQIMFALSGPDRPALYFTVVGEPPLKMLRYQQQFTFFDMARVNESVRYVNLSQEVVNGTLETAPGTHRSGSRSDEPRRGDCRFLSNGGPGCRAGTERRPRFAALRAATGRPAHRLGSDDVSRRRVSTLGG